MGCLRTSGGCGEGEVKGVGWLSVPLGGGEGREKKRSGAGAAPLGPPIRYSLAPLKELRAGGVDVDYKGGASCKRADVRVCGGKKGNSVGSCFQFCS